MKLNNIRLTALLKEVEGDSSDFEKVFSFDPLLATHEISHRTLLQESASYLFRLKYKSLYVFSLGTLVLPKIT
jgi:hypothetical protein